MREAASGLFGLVRLDGRRAAFLCHRAKPRRRAFMRCLHRNVFAERGLSEQGIPEAMVPVLFHAPYVTHTERRGFDLQQL